MEEIVFEEPSQRPYMRNWAEVLDRAGEIVNSYDTGVTLRQLFYRLVSEELIPNSKSKYTSLATRTARARRDGTFPDLVDRGRTIHRYATFAGPDDAKYYLKRIYRRDRTENQDVSIYLAVEKAGIVEQLMSWFGDLGLPILALGGYASQSYVDEIVADASSQNRSAVLLYAGDHDASGEDLYRDFVKRTACFSKVVKVALTPDQVVEHNLPPLPGKAEDTRAARFIAKHGELVQVELDALPPDVLQSLYQQALDEFWDKSAFESSLAQERGELEEL